MKKSGKYIFGFIGILIAVLFLLFINSDSFQKAQNNCKLFEEFQSYILSNNWERAGEMLFFTESDDEQNYLDSINYYIENKPVIENGKLISVNGDITEAITKAKPRLLVTYNYYRSNKSKIDKVVLSNGYALLLNNKIIYIKIP